MDDEADSVRGLADDFHGDAGGRGHAIRGVGAVGEGALDEGAKRARGP